MGLVLLAASALGLGSVGLTGCAAPVEKLQTAAEAARDIAAVAEPCLVASMQAQKEQCAGDRECIAAVIEAFQPMADAFDAFHSAWCFIEPGADGCEK